MSWDLKSVCYFRLFNFVICYSYEKFVFYKARQFWCEKCIIKSCCFFANHLSSKKSFLKFVYTCDKLCPLKVLLINYKLSSQCSGRSFYSGRQKLPILYPFLMVEAYVAWCWISSLKIFLIRNKVSGQCFAQCNWEGLSQPWNCVVSIV